MGTVPTKLLVDGKEMTVDAAAPFTALVHQQGMRIDAPEHYEINSRQTIDCMAKMSQRAWVHISTGPLFKELFQKLFEDKVKLPATIEELNKGDYGVIHGAGMIVLACEAFFEGKRKLFFRTPEDNLHPAVQRNLMCMIYRLMEIFGAKPTDITTDVAAEPPK